MLFKVGLGGGRRNLIHSDNVHKINNFFKSQFSNRKKPLVFAHFLRSESEQLLKVFKLKSFSKMKSGVGGGEEKSLK